MDAWEVLISNSTLTPAPGIDAWIHLNNQGGGPGGGGYVSPNAFEFDVDPLEIEFDPEILEFTFVPQQAGLSFDVSPAQIEFEASAVSPYEYDFTGEKQTIKIVSKNADITFIGEEV